MRIFVTGAAGYIGSHFVRTLLAGGYPAYQGAEVTVYDKLAYAGNLANLASVADDPRYTFVRGDICDGALLDKTLPGHDLVINFAAETHVDRSISLADIKKAASSNIKPGSKINDIKAETFGAVNVPPPVDQGLLIRRGQD